MGTPDGHSPRRGVDADIAPAVCACAGIPGNAKPASIAKPTEVFNEHVTYFFAHAHLYAGGSRDKPPAATLKRSV